MGAKHRRRVAQLRDNANDFLYWRSKARCVWCERACVASSDLFVEWGCGTVVKGNEEKRSVDCNRNQAALLLKRYAELPF